MLTPKEEKELMICDSFFYDFGNCPIEKQKGCEKCSLYKSLNNEKFTLC